MATRKPSSRRAKDAASDFVKRVMKGTWEDKRDMPSVSSQAKSKSKTQNLSTAQILISRSPAKTAVSGSPAKVLTAVSPTKVLISENVAKTLTSGSPTKVLTSENAAKVLTSECTIRLQPVEGECKQSTAGGPIKILTSGSQPKLLTYASALKLQVGKSSIKLLSSNIKQKPEINADESHDNKTSNATTVSASPTQSSCASNSRVDENSASIVESSSGISDVSSSPHTELSTLRLSMEEKEVQKPSDLPNLENCTTVKVLIQDICKKHEGQPVTQPVAGKRPRGRPRKEPTADSKKAKAPNQHPAWLLAGKNKPGRKPKLRTTAASQQSKLVKIDTSSVDNGVAMKTEIKEEPQDGNSISNHGDNLATHTNSNPEKDEKNCMQSGDKCNGMKVPFEGDLLHIKDEPMDDTKPDISGCLLGVVEDKDSSHDFLCHENESHSIIYPSEQGHFLNIFGLIKKSDIKQESLTNKLHREVGGKLRRIVKPRMAPEMVYNKLTLARGCVLEGESEDKKVVIKNNSRSLQKPRPVQSDQLKLRAKLHEVKQSTHIKLTSEQLSHAQSLLDCRKLVEARMLLSEGKMPNSELCNKKHPPENSDLGSNGHKHSDTAVKKEKSSVRCVPSSTSPNKMPARKHPVNKPTTSATTSVKEENYTGTRRSSRHQGSQRKQWWHLLRAAPDEFEQDKAWDEEQDRLEKRRKMLKEKREKELLDQLQAKEQESKEPMSPEESSNSDGKPLEHDVDGMESKKQPKKDVQSASCRDESQVENETGSVSAKDGIAISASPRIARKRRKRKIRLDEDEVLMNTPEHSELVQQIQPLVKNLMEGGTETESMQLEMELKSDQFENCMVKNLTDGMKGNNDELGMLPEVAICDGYQCVIPHMCNTCWINDHMYCLNMKRIARDLPPFGGCLHYSLCSHYPRRDIDQKQRYKCTKLSTSELTAESFSDSTAKQSLLKDSQQPTTEVDLFCYEQLEESDESSPGSPVPKGTEILQAQIKARAVQIAKSLGVPPTEAQTVNNNETVEQLTYSSSDANESDTSDSVDESSVTVNQHGAELVLYNGQSYLPNHVFEDDDGDMSASWLKPAASQKQSPTAVRSPKSMPEGSDHKAKKLQIRLCQPKNLDVPLNDISKVGASHKLVRVKVHRVGDNKILLKQMKDLGSSGSSEVLIRELELPVTSGGNKNEEMDIDWLSNILAEEAVKLVSETDKNVPALDQLKGKKKLKRFHSDVPAPSSPITCTYSDPAQSPSQVDNASDSVPWTLETIDDEDGGESMPEEAPIDLDRDITESEIDPKWAETITITSPTDCKKTDVPIQINNANQLSTDSDNSTLSFTTKEIREEDPNLLSHIKKEPGLLAALCKKLQDERDSIKELIKESDSILSAYDEDQNQKACLLAALQSERSMLDDEIKLKRETINKLAETTGNISKFCSCLELSKEELEDCISTFTEILANLEKRGMLLGHPDEMARLHSYNRRLQKVIDAAISEPNVADIPAVTEENPELMSNSDDVVLDEVLSCPAELTAAGVNQSVTTADVTQVTNLVSSGGSTTRSQPQNASAQSSPISGKEAVRLNVPLSVFSNVIETESKIPALNVTFTLDQLKKVGLLEDAIVTRLASPNKSSSGGGQTTTALSRESSVVTSSQTVTTSPRQVSTSATPVAVVAATNSSVKSVMSSKSSSQACSTGAISKPQAGGISLLGTSLLKQKPNKLVSPVKSQPRKATTPVAITSADFHATSRSIHGQSSTEKPHSFRVITAAGIPTSLPHLSPSVLRAIGPNDQIVVLSADQLRQFQEIQEPPYKPVQIRIPLSKSLPVLSTKLQVSGVTRVQPLQDKQTKSHKQTTYKKITKSGKVTVTRMAEHSHANAICDNISHTKPNEQSSIPHRLPAKGLSGLPVEVTTVETLQQQSHKDSVTDLLQLAMENSQISPKALASITQVNADEGFLKEECIPLCQDLAHSVEVSAMPEEAALDNMVQLETPFLKSENNFVEQEQSHLTNISNPELCIMTSEVLPSTAETDNAAIFQPQASEIQYGFQYVDSMDKQYSGEQVLELSAPFAQSLVQQVQKVSEEEKVQYTMQTVGVNEESSESKSLGTFHSVNELVEQSFDQTVQLQCQNNSQLEMEMPMVVNDCSEQLIIGGDQEPAVCGITQDIQQVDSACRVTQEQYQCVELSEPTASSDSNKNINCDQVIIEMVNADGSIVYHHGAPVHNTDSDLNTVTYQIIDPKPGEILQPELDCSAGTVGAAQTTYSKLQPKCSDPVQYEVVETDLGCVQTVQLDESAPAFQLADNQVQMSEAISLEGVTVDCVQSDLAAGQPSSDITYTIQDDGLESFIVPNSMLSGYHGKPVQELVVANASVIEDQYYDVQQFTDHQASEHCSSELLHCEDLQ